jgi:hypothetical protein
VAVKPYTQYLDAATIAEIDAELALNRGDSCVIQRKSGDLDAAGAPVSGGYTTVATVTCRVKSAGRVAGERAYGGQFGPEADYEITMPRDTDVRSDDQIVVNGKTMQVVGDDDAKSYGFELVVGAKAT